MTDPATGVGAQVAAVAPGRRWRSPSTRSLSQSGVISLVGFGLAAVFGFLLTVVVGRGLGPAGAGSFFTTVAVATVAGTVVKLGADTGLVWAVPRAVALGREADVRPTVRLALLPVAVLSSLAAGFVFLAAPELAEVVSDGSAPETETLLRLVVPFLVLAPAMALVIACLRGLGDVVPYALLQNVAVPGLRALLALAVVLTGGGVLGVTLAWVVPVVLVTLIATLLLRRRLRRLEGDVPATPVARLRVDFWRFSVMRSMAAVFEVVLVWSDVLLVAALASPAEAGIYAAASRFITTGTLVEAAMRVTLAPRVSSLFAVGDLTAAARLHGLATSWIVALSWPLYLVLGVFSPLMLGLFGAEFRSGAGAMTVLATAMLAATATGNSQTMLLMSGRSAWQLIDKLGAVLVNLALCALLIPRYGMLGAAWAWALTIVLDSAVVWLQVRHLVGLRIELRTVGTVMAAALACFGLPTVLTRLLLGTGAGPVALCLAVSAVTYLAVLSRCTGLLDGKLLLGGRAAATAGDVG